MKINQRLFYPCILCVFLILSCQNKPGPISSTPTTNVPNTGSVTPEKKAIKIEEMTYESATVYAASTDYFFKNGKGEVVKIRISDLEENPKVSLPTNLLEVNIEEGPPGANPDMVGKKMRVTYGADNQIQKIRIASESQNIKIKMGSSLADIEALNGKPFMLVGFEVDGDIAGKVTDWKGGKLTDRVVQFEVTIKLTIKEYQQIMGDDLFSSDNPVMKKAGLKVIYVD